MPVAERRRAGEAACRLPVWAGPVLPALPEYARVSAVPNCLAPHKRWAGRVPALCTLERAVATVCDLAHVPRLLRGGGTLWLNGVKIPRCFWPSVRLNSGDNLEFIVLPRGGDNFFNSLIKMVGAVVGIAIMAWAPFGAVGFLAGLGNGLLGLATTVGFSLLANAIAPIRPPSLSSPSLNQRSASPTYSLNASSNSMSYGAPVRKIYGRHLVPPTRILDDYTELNGTDQYLYMLTVVGFGPLQMEGLQLGETALDLYQDVSTQICYGRPGEAIPDIMPMVVYQTTLSIQLLSTDSLGNQLNSDAWWVTRSTEPGVDEIGIDVQAPQGLYTIDDNANRHAVTRRVEYRFRKKAGLNSEAGPWQGASQSVKNQVVSVPQAVLPGYTHSYWDPTAAGYEGASMTAQIPAVNFEGTCFLYLDAYGAICLARFNAQKGAPYKDNNGRWHGTAQISNPTVPAVATLICTVLVSGMQIVSYSLGQAALDAGITVEQSGQLSLRFTDGVVSTTYSTISLTGSAVAPDKAVRKSVKWRVPYSDTGYDIQVRRSERESNDTRVADALYWSAIRAADTTKKPYVGDIPLAMIGMRILASNQLQNSVPLLTLIATAELPDWDAESRTWIERPTRSPAAAFLDALRGPANFRPRPAAEIHFESIQAWSEWCEEYGYRFDGVYDSQSVVYDVLADIAAAGRGSPCLIEGKWGVVWQRKQPGQPAGHVTVRNSRDFTSSRSYKDPIHGLRISFINEEKRYEQDELTVYAPGYTADTATLFEKIELFGTTNPTQAAIKGQWHLHEALLLIEQYSAIMPLEYLRLRKGQKIRVLRPEVLYGIGSAAVTGWVLDDNGQMISLTWDTEMKLTPGVRYGAIVRLIDGSEWTVTGTSTDGRTLTLEEPLPPPLSGRLDEDGNPIPLIRRGDLVMVGTAGDVGRMCLVTGIRPGDNLTATVSFVDYIDELYENDDGTIPDYTPSITVPGTGPLRRAATPTIIAVYSDERALAGLPGGGTQPRIYLEWQFNDTSNSARVQFRRRGDDAWTPVPAMPLGATSCYISGVLEGYAVENGVRLPNGIAYDLRVQAVNDLGWSSEWALAPGHVVVGRTTPPPAPSGVFLSGYSVRIEQNNRPLDVAGHKIFMAMDENDGIGMALELTNPYTTTGTFDLQPWAGRARAVFVRTVDELGLMSEPVRIVVNLGDVLPDNVLFEHSERQRQWSGEITGGYVAGDSLFSEERAALYPQDNAAPLYPHTTRMALYPSGAAETLVYTWNVNIPQGYAGARVLVLPDALSGRLQILEFRHYADVALYAQDSGAPCWPQNDAAALYPQPHASDWEPLPDNYITPGGETLEFRVTYANTERAQLLDIRTILDVVDRELSLEDVTISAAGDTRVNLPERYFRAITNVVFGLQYVDGSTAVSVQRVPNSEIMGTNGYLTAGPIIRAFSAQGATVFANCDIRIRGY